MIIRNLIFSNEDNAVIQVTPHFTIKPCPDHFPRPPYGIGHYPYFIDYDVPKIHKKKGVLCDNLRSDNKPKITDFKFETFAGDSAQVDSTKKKFNEIITLTNVLGHTLFFQYGNKQSWFINLGNDEYKMYFGQESYKAPKFNMSPKEFETLPWYTIAEPSYFNVHIDTDNYLAINLQDLIEAYDTCDDKMFKKDYLNAAFVLTKSFRLREIDYSASYLFMVAAIEALVKIEHQDQKIEHCTNCGQETYKVSKKFKDFLKNYGFETDNAIKNKFYKMRSNISHNGNLLGMSYDTQWIIENQEELDQDYQRFIDRLYHEQFESLAKTCFRYFLLIKTGYLEKLIKIEGK